MALKHTVGFILTLCILFAMGCQKAEDPMRAEPDDIPNPSVIVDEVKPDKKPDSENVFIGEAGEKLGTDRYVLNTATIEGDTLEINVSYSGGCETHKFTLVVSESFLESFPVQLHVSLAHNAMDDLCKAWLTEDYNFDLTLIKSMYQEAYRQEVGTIILRLKDAPNIELVYKFTM